jgi:tRNA A-37 threonylcarbamoyl transferase component Bud32
MNQYVTKAQVPADEPSLYVERESDSQFDDYLRRSEYIAVLGPKYSGKTSLLARKFHGLRSRQRHLPIYINVSPLRTLDGEAWHQRLHSLIIEGGGGELAEAPLATNALRLRDALLHILKDQIQGRVLVIMLDDVEMIPLLILTPLMAMIREIYSSREITEAFKRCVFVLAGCFLPDDLIADPTISPFRVAERIHVLDATINGVTQLTSLMRSMNQPLPNWLPERVYAWTEGDLYLTQRLCALLEHYSELTMELVDQIAAHALIEDDIFHSIIHHLDRNPRLVPLLEKIRLGTSPVRFTRLQRQIAEAWLVGLVKEDARGTCAIRNRVYQTFLDVIVFSNAGTGPLPSPSDETDNLPMPGRVTLNERYRIEEPLQEGGMGQVFRGTDLLTKEPIAIKRLLRELASHPKFAERFQREGESLRQLSHPNIVRFIDLFLEDEHQYIVMEYVPGGNLSQLMHREGRSLPVATVVHIAAKLVDALAHAHSCNIIHRDIKPGNVLLTPDMTPRLADFGLARLLDRERVTEVGALIGTYAYMSPEVRRGEDASPQSDIWSVGVMLFEMLAGYLPFTGMNAVSLVLGSQGDPIPDIRTIREDVPAALAELIARLLSHSPAARGESAADLSRELHELAAVLEP